MFTKLNSSLIAVISILKLVEICQCDWIQHPDIRTGHISLYNPVTGTLYSSATPVSYWIPYSTPISTAKSAGVSVVSFNTLITNDFAVNTTIQNFTISALRITGRVYGDTILTFFFVNYIAVGNSVTFAQVLFDCYLCATISTGRGARSENRTAVTFLIGYATLNVNVYLAGFALHNSDGLTNYLTADVSIASGSNIIDYKFSVSQNNTVSSICYTTTVLSIKATQDQLYYDWGQTGNQTLSNAAGKDPSLFQFPAGNNPDYQEVNRMFFGISSFGLSRANRRVFNFQTYNYTALSTGYQTNEGTFSVRIDYFWLARRECNSSHKYFDANTTSATALNCVQNCSANPTNLYKSDVADFCYGCHYSCDTCDGALSSNCTDCNISLFRNPVGSSCPCNTSYIDIGYSLCYPCSVFIAGCDTCSSTLQCTACSPGFIMTAFGKCACTTGSLISGVCVNITGCTNATVYGGNVYCTACNTTLNYQVTANYTCDCMSAYYMNSNGLCISKCGDAKKANDEGCDDGNLVSGDGCSSLCTVQQNWVCDSGSLTTPSICYIDNMFTMTVKYVRRDTTANRMQVGIKIQPIMEQLTMTNFKRYLTHNMPCSSENVTYANNILIFECDYTRSIEGESFDLKIMLDPTLFYNSKLSVSIPASGMNAKLTYDSNNTINKPLEIIVIILDVLAIIVMFASCASERMIGVEMIQTLQTVLYTQAVMKTTPSSLSPLQMLRYSSGFNEAQGIDYTRTYTFAFSLSSIGLEKEFLLSYNVMYIILMVTIVVCLLLKIKQHYHENKKVTQDEGMKNEQKWSTATKIYSFIFERILFLIAFMCMFLIVFALMLQMTSMQGSYSIMSKEFNILGGIVAIAIIATMICGVILNGCFPGILLFPMLMKQFYPPIYFVYQSTFIFVLAINYTQQYTLYILGAMSLLFLLYNVIHRPYPQKFHTFVLIFHQVIIMGAIGIYILENFTKPAEHQTLYKIGNVVVIALLYVVVFANGYRIYAYYKFLRLNGWDQYGNPTNQFYDENEIAAEYKNLQTPKALQGLRPTEQDYLNRDLDKKKAAKTQKNDDLNELGDLKKASLDKTSKSKPPLQDESNIKWNYNKLADDDNNLDNTRYQGTSRDVRPDTSRDLDKSLMRTKTNEKNLRNPNDGTYNKNTGENNPDEQFTIKDIEENGRGRSKSNNKNSNTNQKTNPKTNNLDDHDNSYHGEDGNENVFDNPYDDSGYPSNNKDRSKYAEENQLEAIKKKLKQDFSMKVKSSTLRQS